MPGASSFAGEEAFPVQQVRDLFMRPAELALGPRQIGGRLDGAFIDNGVGVVGTQDGEQPSTGSRELSQDAVIGRDLGIGIDQLPGDDDGPATPPDVSVEGLTVKQRAKD